MRVAGIDPGTQSAGYAMVELRSGVVVSARAGSWSLERGRQRGDVLLELARNLNEWLENAQPSSVAIETVFTFKNQRSALILSEARGVVLAEVARFGVPAFDYTPAAVKKSIAGGGLAAKSGTRIAVRRLLPRPAAEAIERLTDDAVDALAIALCHAWTLERDARLARAAR